MDSPSSGRIYDPVIGRFLSADPYPLVGRVGLADPSGRNTDVTQVFNRYSYVNNNPLSYTDPSGFEGQSKTWPNEDVISLPAITVYAPRFNSNYTLLDPGSLAGFLSSLGGEMTSLPEDLASLLDKIQESLKRADSNKSDDKDDNKDDDEDDDEDKMNDPRCYQMLPDGSTVAQNRTRLRLIIRSQVGPPGAGYAAAFGAWFQSVLPNGPWDYKTQPGGTDAMGNFNYGATGSLFFPDELLLRAAGAVQGPNPENQGHFLDDVDDGPTSFGDQPQDQQNIIEGIHGCN